MIAVFIETADNEIKKSSAEAVSYARSLADKTNDSVSAIVFGSPSDLNNLGNFGADQVLQIKSADFNQPDLMKYSSGLAQAVQSVGASTVILAKSSLVDGLASRLSIKLKASISTNVVSLPDLSQGFVVKKSIYTGKAFANEQLTSANKVLVIKKNVSQVLATGKTATVSEFNPTLSDLDKKIAIKDTQKATGEVLLPEAAIVVSGGRGLKGPENWGVILDLAKELGAATGCSKPVSDMDWRPHHEHVGQTGVKVSPNLYIAVGISGAIQHLAGVNSSKCIVVINKDPEAPFFKAADYGIVGDLFEVLPKLTAAFKAAK
ncbi:MAG: electron transfer flavoprotein subunit alpha/FixB family protein [Cytophagales bacterium]|nr:electron transfer flavoprotein subunit alpha/FixB family protein [Cytophagales bacterium]